jgi:hypothetical protein
MRGRVVGGLYNECSTNVPEIRNHTYLVQVSAVDRNLLNQSLHALSFMYYKM